jgi:NDP-4-keto-2,6-dideoxyhexose 3-C-methyltransferase
VALSAGDLVLDIGSNDSTLLRAMDAPGVQLVGMDPSGIKFRELYPPQVQLIPDFFSAERFRREFGNKRASVVTSIAMFYDLERPLDFVQQVYEVLEDNGIWVFEQSYLPTMLARNSYDTICHEHIEYYALKQILWMFEKVGFTALNVEFNDINGGSFSVTAGKKAAGHTQNSAVIERLIREEEELGLSGAEIYRQFRERVAGHRDELKQFLANSRGRGEKIFGYGASTKGNVLLQYCGLIADDLPYIAEVNHDKFGAFTPGSKIPIISEEEAREMNPSGFLVLPWHFRDNIVGREQAFLASGGRLIFPLPMLEVVGN